MFFAAPLLGSAISPFIVMRIHRCISAYRANRLYAFPFLLSLDSIENLGSITSRCLIKGRALLPREGRPDTRERRKSSLQKTIRFVFSVHAHALVLEGSISRLMRLNLIPLFLLLFNKQI